jgi:putative isomerase
MLCPVVETDSVTMSSSLDREIGIIREHILRDRKGMLRESSGVLKHPFLVPGSATYADQLWDWDSWLADIALHQIVAECGDEPLSRQVRFHARGCVLNFLEGVDWEGWIPPMIAATGVEKPADTRRHNLHKPCLAQHAAFLVREAGGDADWLRAGFAGLQAFVNAYHHHHRHADTGLFFWQNDYAIGVDNDPCTYYRPERSSGSIFLNTLMYRELLAMVYLAERLNLAEIAQSYQRDAEALQAAIQKHCWDPWLGFYFSVDFNLTEAPAPGTWSKLHQGGPRRWSCLIQRIGVWSGFLPLWAGVATPEQAQAVARHYWDERTFHALAGVRTLSKLEAMYDVRASGNPSSWLGPVWGISNYMVFRGFVRYGLDREARDLAEKTIRMFARDFERHGLLHEYYQPENGEPVLNPGFQNWNYLVMGMIRWLEGADPIEEF